jgi:hypothetical protein
VDKIQGSSTRNLFAGIATAFTLFFLTTVHAQTVPCASPTLDSDGDGIPDIIDNCILVPNANQRDTTGTNIGNACNPDLNHDGIVNAQDLALWKIAFNAYNATPSVYNPNADFNGDGKIDAADLAILEKYLGKAPGPAAAVPSLQVSPTTLNFGSPFVGVQSQLTVTVTNNGCRPVSVTGASLVGDPSFQIFPPTALTLVSPGQSAAINIGFTPATTASVGATLTLATTSGLSGTNIPVTLSGVGLLPTPEQTPTLVAPTTITWQPIYTNAIGTQSLGISNTGTAPLVIAGIQSSNTAFTFNVALLGGFPLTVAPGTNVAIPLTLTATSTTGPITGTLTIENNDPLRSSYGVALSGIVNALPAVQNNPVTGVQVLDGQTVITQSNCASVSRAVTFGTGGQAGDTFEVVLTDGAGNTVTSSPQPAPSSPGTVVLSGINICSLDDSSITVSVLYFPVSGGTAPTYVGTPATKNTSTLPAPTLTPPTQPYFTATTANICGTSRASTTVTINGGSSAVSTVLGASATTFCLTVPLQPNMENTLVATAIDNLAAPPRPSESSLPLEVTQVNPSQIVIASATSTQLNASQIATLVQNGVINLNDPQNFNFSIFTVVLTIGSLPVTVTQVVPQCEVNCGGGGGGGGGGSGGGGGWSPGPPVGTASVPTCTSDLCTHIVVIPPPQPGLPAIPGILIIDGTIKTLKQFFQVTLAIQNTSSSFTLSDVGGSITLPAGDLTAVTSGVGTNVGSLTTTNAPTTISLGSIAPGATGSGQFIVRGDAIGNYELAVSYNGTITGAGLANGIPFNGEANTSVEVSGPPNLSVNVSFPVTGTSYDVLAGTTFPLTVNITNTSSQPALYPSINLVVGGNLTLINPALLPAIVTETNQTNSLPNINPNQTVTTTFLMQSSAQGYVIACQGLASGNVSLSVDVQGNQNAGCNIANSLPVDFVPAPAGAPPTVIGISPTNGQGDQPITTSVVAEFTPITACLVGDTFNNVTTALIDPENPSAGIQVTSADLATQGTFYLEELDASGNAVRHVPTEYAGVSDSINGTTVATLRLGLASPLSQYFLKSHTNYRATIVGTDRSTVPGGAVCNGSNQTPIKYSYSWEFQTQLSCVNDTSPVASLSQPANGSVGNQVNLPIVINFLNPSGNGISGSTFNFDPVDPLADTFAAFAGATISGGDVSGGSLVTGNLNLTNGGQTLTLTPTSNLPNSTQVVVRLTNSLKDTCGTPLSTPANGVQLFSFQTAAAPAVPPAAPKVNPVPALTNQSTIIVTGTAAAGTTITITGGAATAANVTGSGGNFSVSVSLTTNAKNTLSVTATDTAGNVSAATTTDIIGNSLVVQNDQTAPTVALVTPANGSAGAAVGTSVTATFSKQINVSTATTLGVLLSTGGTAVPGTVGATATGVSFTPSAPLTGNTLYQLRIRAGASFITDLAGNPLASDFVSSFTTAATTSTLTSVSPNSGTAGTTFAVTFTGTNLSGATGVVSGIAGISGTITATSSTSVGASITISASAAAGATSLGLSVGGTSYTVPFTVIAATSVTSVSPAFGTVGTSLPVVFTGTNLTGATAVLSGNAGVSGTITSASATSVSASITILGSATTGGTTLGLKVGGTNYNLSFTVNPAVTVTSVSQVTGIVGTTFPVTFTGTNLSSATAVVSGNAGVSGTVTSTSATSVGASITITSAAAIGGTTVGLVVNGTPYTVSFTVDPATTLASLNPASGTAGTTFPVTFTGTGLSSASAVVSGNSGVSGTITSTSATSVTASITITGAASTGTTTLGLKVGATSYALNFTVNPAVTLTSVSPASGTVGTTFPVTFTGTGLASATAVLSSNAGISGTITSASATSVSASITITAGAATGSGYTIGLTVGGTSYNSLPFTVTPAVTLTSVSPASGTVGTTFPVTFTGTGLSSATAVVSGNSGVSGTITSTSATSVTASITITGAAAIGGTTIGLTVGGTNNLVAFTVNPAVTLTSVSPASGTVGTTFPVTFTGTGLSSASAVVSGNSGVSGTITSTSATSVTASITITGAAATGTTTLGLKVGSTSYPLNFTVNPAVTLTSVSPASGTVGTTFPVTFTGTGLSSATAVVSGNSGVSGTITSTSATSVTASITITGAAATGGTTIGLTVGGTNNFVGFTVNPAVTLTSVSPASGATGTTFPVTFTGTSLTGTTAVTSPNTGVTATLGTVTSTTVAATVTISASATLGATTLSLTVGGQSVPIAFTVVSGTPTLTSVSPASGAGGSTFSVTFTGTNLSAATAVISGNAGISGTISGAPSSTSVSASITITAGAATGGTTLGLTVGSQNVSVAFTVTAPAPTITGLTPASGEQGHTVPVTITGTNLLNITAISVSGAGVTASAAGGGSSTSQSATFVITSGAATGLRTVSVTTASGVATAGFTVNAAPALAVSLSPQPLTLSTESSTTLTVTLSDLAPTGGTVVNLATGAGLVSVPTTVTIAQNQTSNTVTVTSTASAGSDTITASGTGLTSGTDTVQVSARGFSVNAGLVGLGRTATGVITLNQPAPSTGATINLAITAGASLVSVSPASVTIPSGATTATFTLTGGSTIGSATLTADGTGSGFNVQTAPLTITNLLINLSAAQTLAFGEAATYQVQIAPNAAGAGGVVISLASSNTNIATVPATVTIPAGAFAVNFTVQTGTTTTGATTISASNSNFAPTTTTGTVTAALALTEASKTLSSTQTDTVAFQLTSGGSLYNAPAGGEVVTGSSTNTACVNLTSTSFTIPAGQSYGSLPIAYGSTATLPCTATVTVSNALFGSATIPVTYQAGTNLGTITVGSAPYGIGNGLEYAVSVNLSAVAPAGGAIVEVTSSNPSLLLLSGSSASVGAPAINVSFAAGTSSATIYLQATSGSTGNVTLTAKSAQYTTGTMTETVSPAALYYIYAPGLNTTVLTGSSPIGVGVAVIIPASNTSYCGQASGCLAAENLGPQTGPLTVTATSSNPSVGALQNGSTNAATATAVIPVGVYYTGNSDSGFTFVPLSTGSTTVSLSAPGFQTGTFNSGSYVSAETYTVSQPTMSLSAGPAATGYYGVGVGLAVQGSITLAAPAPAGGSTIQVTSSNSAAILVSTSNTTVGSGTVSVAIAAGQTTGNFYLQGVGVGTSNLSAVDPSNTYATPAAVSMTAESSALYYIYAPDRNVTILTGTPPSTSPIGVGVAAIIPASNASYCGQTSGCLVAENVGPQTGPLTVTATSSNPSVGELQTGETNAATATAVIPVGVYYTGNSDSGFTFVPLAAGSTTVSLSAPGFLTGSYNTGGYVSAETYTITVSQPSMTLSAGPAATGYYGVGEGLAVQGSVTLATPAPTGGSTIQVTSSNSAAILVSTSNTTVGTGTASVAIAAGQTTGNFYLQGVGVGTSNLSAVDPSNTYASPAAVSMTAEPSALYYIYAPDRNVTILTGTPPSTSPIGVGVAAIIPASNASYCGQTSGCLVAENVGPQTGPLTVTATSSNPSVGELQTGGTNAATATAVIPVGVYYTGNSDSGFTFVPLAAGSTTVSLSAPGFLTGSYNTGGYVSAETYTITVSQPSMTLSAGPAATGYYGVGEGLAVQGSVTLATPAPTGGSTIQVTSSNSAAILVSTSNTTVGTGTASVAIAAGQTTGNFYLQGVGVGTSNLSAVDPSNTYTSPAAVSMTAEPSALYYIYAPDLGTTVLSAPSPIGVGVAAIIPASNASYCGQASGCLVAENVGPQTGPLTVTATSSNPSVGELQTGGTNAATATAVIPVGVYYTGNSDSGFTFVPLTTGTTTVSVSAPGFLTGSYNSGGYVSSETYTVADSALSLQSNVQVGSGLQVQMTGSLQANNGTVTIRLTSGDATSLLLSPDGVTPGEPFIDITVVNGNTSYPFYAIGVAGAVSNSPGVTVTATTSDTSFAPGTTVVAVVKPELLFYSGLPTSESASSADAPFEIATYVPNYNYETVAAGQTLTVTLTSSNTGAADLTTSSATQASSVTITLSAGQDLSAGSVAGGGVALHAVGTGTTIINATAPGVTSASQTVTLN